MNAYPHLFTPLALRHLELPNRVVMGSMHMGLEEQRGGWKRLARFYAERAEAGVGLIVTGGISPSLEGALAPGGAVLRFPFQTRRHRRGKRLTSWRRRPTDRRTSSRGKTILKRR